VKINGKISSGFLLRYHLHTTKLIHLSTVHCYLVYSQGYTTITTNRFQNVFLSPERNSIPISSHFPLSPPPCPTATANLLSVTIDFPSLDFHVSGIKQHVVFCDWLLSLSMFPWFIHAVAHICTSFLIAK